MIYDHVSNLNRYTGLHSGLDHAIELLLLQHVEVNVVGNYIAGHDVDYYLFQNYRTKTADTCDFETHQRMIDLQLMVEGTEMMGYAPVADLIETIPYNVEKDIAFYNGSGVYVKLEPGYFCIFFNFEAHQPCIATDASCDVKKIVFKIKA